MKRKDILDLIYPQRCPFCNMLRPYGAMVVCPGCLKTLKRVEQPQCFKCGKTIEGEEEEYCRDCYSVSKSFRRGFPVFNYTGAVKQALYDFKYNNQRNYAEFFADCIFMAYGGQFEAVGFDGLVPVPVHAHKRRIRGYNQAEVLARYLGRHLHLPVYPHYLIRLVDTSPQKELNDKARMKNIKNAFKIGENRIKLKKVLLVDDIYTSGATIEACTRVLLAAGVQEVYYTSVAVGKGYSG